jgi:hypothetical protein
MPIPIIVEDGSIVPLANSYVTVAGFRQFCEERGVGLPLSDDSISVFLIKAVDYLEASLFCYRGFKVNSSQSLQWPRFAAIVDRVEISSTVIPVGIKNAQMQGAIALNSGIELLPNLKSSDFVKKEEVGPLKVEYFDSSNLYPNNARLLSLESLIKPYLNNSCEFSNFNFATVRV